MIASITGIDLSGYMVKDTQRAIGFYREHFGMEPVFLYPDDRGAEYAMPDGSTFGLWGGGTAPFPFQPSNGILFAVKSVDDAVAKLQEKGVPIVFQIETPVCYMAMIQDTEGNTVCLHQRKSTA